jgi:sulfatase maturation enzyme AslB (radical SAM superfamily)
MDLNLSPTGHYGLCCAADHSAHVGNDRVAANQPIEQHWNSELMRSTRQQFMAGQLPDICRGCAKDEESGIRSRRHRMNQRYLGEDSPETQHPAVQELLQQTRVDGHSTAVLRGVDISYGNTCQLRCIQCSPSYSRSVSKDYAKLGWDHNHKNRMPIAVPDRAMQQDSATHSTLEQIKQHIHTMQYIKFVGGEPTITRPLLQFMDWCIEQGHNQRITVLLNTNAISVSDKFINCLKQFKKVLMGISVDGVGPLDEWIRFPTNWERKYSNIQRLMQALPHSYIATTLFNLNTHLLPELITWCRQHNYRHSIVRLNWPEFFSIQHLPGKAKQDLARLLDDFANTLPPDHIDDRSLVDNQYRAFLKGTINFMLENQNNSTQWQRCIDTVESYNSIRPQSLQQVNPFFRQFL